MNIGISEQSSKKIADSLHRVLANQHLFYQKLRNFHWNIKGKGFIGLHKFFEEMYTELAEDIDVVAERIQSIGQKTKGTYAEYLELAEIKEQPGVYPESEAMVVTLVEDIETLIRVMRASADVCTEHGDTSSEAVLVDCIAKHEKQAWILRSTTE